MTGPLRSGPTPTEAIAPGGTWRPSLGYLAVALGIVLGALAYAWMSTPPATRVADATASPASLPMPANGATPATPLPAAPVAGATEARAASAAPPAPVPEILRSRDPGGDLTPDIADFVNKGERPTMAEVIERLHQAGVHGGLGAFPPPGSRPPLVGLAVPEGFALPEGYVRHYQATDDGQRIEPILMYSPDHRFVDAAGQPLAIPTDRVVPPEAAPPGLPIRRIVIPAPTEPGRPGR